MILCAGLGTRLKPWTLVHPKALVPVAGVPMLKRVSDKLFDLGFNEQTLNVHHFARQVIDFVEEGNLKVCNVHISDESECLLDTGGGILRAEKFLSRDSDPFLVHNVDILSDADLRSIYEEHRKSGRDVTLLVSDRKSDRKLVFDNDMKLKGWRNLKTGEVRPANFEMCETDVMLSFSGIYVMSPSVFAKMKAHDFEGKFPIMDFLLTGFDDVQIRGMCQNGFQIIDIGKPDTLVAANRLLK